MKELENVRSADFNRSRNRAGLFVFGLIVLLAIAVFLSIRWRSSSVLLNVSYDASYGFFHDVDQMFEGREDGVKIRTSHDGSVQQATSVIRGLKVDVVTLASAAEIDSISERGLIHPGWRDEFPHQSSPFTSTVVFLVRGGNPKMILDWDDLTRKDVALIVPSPRVSGVGRWAYLAVWVYARGKTSGDDTTEQFVREVYANGSTLDKGARSALQLFMSGESGDDVLVTWENEAWHALEKFGSDQLEIVYPSVSIKAEPVVAIVDQIATERNTVEKSGAYLKFLFSETGQRIAAENYLRPRDGKLPLWTGAEEAGARLVSVEEGFGSWKDALKLHFSEGGSVDRILPEDPR